MNALKECHRDIVDIYGYAVQVVTAVGFWHQMLEGWIDTGVARPNYPISFGIGDPNQPNAMYSYERTLRYCLEASAKEGSIMVLHRRSLVVLLYSAWEDNHRGRVAGEIGLKSKNDLKSDVFGDVRAYRRAIIHASGKLVTKPKVLPFFKKGEEVDFTCEHIDHIVIAIVEELNRIGTDYYGTNPNFTFEQPLHRP